jgi:hypothetical protein
VYNAGLIEHKKGVIKPGTTGAGAIFNHSKTDGTDLGTLNKYCEGQITLSYENINPDPVDLCFGIIVIQKNTVPDDATDFSFSGGLGAFVLDDDADGTQPNQRTFSSKVPGSYSVTEAAATGFTLTGIACTSTESSGDTTTWDLTSRTATIDLDAYETVTCTFTNEASCSDADGDGYTNATCGGTDCDDADAGINPGATETCNGVDDDCDGQIDEGVKTTFYRDADGDAYGNADVTTQACNAPTGYVADNTDCNDADEAINPGATESCNGVDDDCDGQIDEGVKTTFYRDADSDSYGNADVTTQACTAPTGYVADNTDCKDADEAINPGATESCNGVDDDCDGQIR